VAKSNEYTQILILAQAPFQPETVSFFGVPGFDDQVFDFGPDPLAMLGGRLAREQKLADAIAILQFNARQFPDSQRTLGILADVQAANGDKASAIATLPFVRSVV